MLDSYSSKEVYLGTFLDFFNRALGRFAGLEGFVGSFGGAPMGVGRDRGRHTVAVATGLESEGYRRQVERNR